MGEILKELPAVILRGSVLLPGVVSHFDISARKSIHAVETAMNGDNCIFLVTQKDMQTENATQDDVYAIGVIAEIKQIVKMQNHVVRVIVEAKEKAELAYFIDNDELLKAQVVLSDEGEEKEIVAPEVEEAMLRALQEELLKSRFFRSLLPSTCSISAFEISMQLWIGIFLREAWQVLICIRIRKRSLITLQMFLTP